MKKIVNSIFIMLIVFFVVTPVYALHLGNEIEHENTENSASSMQRKKAGTYFFDLELKETDYEADKFVTKLHVKYPKTRLDYDNQEGIDAHDILVLTGTFDTTNNKNIINQANAHAWSMEDGQAIPNISVLVKDPIKHTGTINQVEFSTVKKTAVEVNVFEQDEINIKLEELYMNQYPVIVDSIRTLSSLFLFLAVLPTGIYFIVFTFIKKEAKEMEQLLGE